MSWVQLKKDYLEGHGDSLDLVPIAGWRGQGRKKEWISPWLLACWDKHTESFQSVCRVMSGFDDAFYKANSDLYSQEEVVLEARPADVETGENPPFWWKPFEVWEIKGADITISPVHSAGAGLVHPSRGLSLRFPRFIRKRLDKRVEDATTSDEIANLFRRQEARATNSSAAPADKADEDY